MQWKKYKKNNKFFRLANERLAFETFDYKYNILMIYIKRDRCEIKGVIEFLKWVNVSELRTERRK